MDRQACSYFHPSHPDADGIISDYTIFAAVQISYHFPSIDYLRFLKRRIQLSKERAKKVEKKTQNIKVKLTNTLREVELDFQENGVDASEEELLAELVRRVRG